MRLVSTAALSPGLYKHTLIGMLAILNLANHVPCFSVDNITYYDTENIRVCNILSVAPANNLRNSLHGRVTAFLIPRFIICPFTLSGKHSWLSFRITKMQFLACIGVCDLYGRGSPLDNFRSAPRPLAWV